MDTLMRRISSSDLRDSTCLPLGVYSLLRSSGHDALVAEAGVLQKDGRLHVAQQKYAGGQCIVMTSGIYGLV